MEKLSEKVENRESEKKKKNNMKVTAENIRSWFYDSAPGAQAYFRI